MFFFKKKKEKQPVESDKTVRNDTLPFQHDNVELASGAEAQAFTNRIGDAFVGQRKLELTDEEISQMSVSDGAEMIRLEQWAMQNILRASPELTEQLHARMDRIIKRLAEKILELDEVYVVFSKITGCPYLFARTYQSDQGYVTEPPLLRVYTKAYSKIVAESADNSELELRRIGADVDGGISGFLARSFYMDGACGIELNSDMCVINQNLLAAPPDFSNVPEVSRPVMNPDVMRWSLLMAQLGNLETDDQKTLYTCYCHQLDQVLPAAKFLIPMKPGEGFPKASGTNETVTLQKDAKFGIMTMEGKNEKPAVYLYTDWVRFWDNLGKDSGWNGMITDLAGIISVYDCAINVDKTYPTRGFYIDQEQYDRMTSKQ